MSAAFGDRLRNLPQYLLPQRAICRATYRITRSARPWLKNRLISAFCARFGVDMGEAEQPDPLSYPTFNAFFTRALRADARPLAAAADALCSPVDGAVSQAGTIDGDTLLQAKGRRYSLLELLAGDEQLAAALRGGSFATLYLSPRDYHRIHMPLDGVLTAMAHVPGRLFSVSPLTTRVVPRLFARNERLINVFQTASGPFALVMVGAINVGSMSTVWAGEVTPAAQAFSQPRWWRYAEPRQHFAKGQEIGRFNMGSTVILLAAPGALHWDAELRAEAPLKMGQVIGKLRSPA